MKFSIKRNKLNLRSSLVTVDMEGDSGSANAANPLQHFPEAPAVKAATKAAGQAQQQQGNNRFGITTRR